MLVDSHCHLDYLEKDGDLEDVVARARASGVGAMVTIGTTLSGFPAVRAIAERFRDVWCTVGVHPHEAAGEGVSGTEALVERAELPQVVGIGETGLDYYYGHSPREAQIRSFSAHCAAARESGLPLVVHTRDADDDTIAVLRRESRGGALTGVIHCFSTSRALAEAALDLGFYISLSGIITFNRADALRETVRDLPLERLLVETDAPYLAPVPRRGKRNEPALVVHTAAKLAELKETEPEDIARITTENFYALFSKATPPEAG